MITLMILLSMFVQDTKPQAKDFLSYKEAYAQYEKSKRPVVIIVTQAGCTPCAVMKKSLLGFKNDYPSIILSEISIPEARKLFPKDTFDSTPQTIMFAYDNDTGQTTRFKTLRGPVSKEGIYKYWEIE